MIIVDVFTVDIGYGGWEVHFCLPLLSVTWPIQKYLFKNNIFNEELLDVHFQMKQAQMLL